MAVLRAVHDLAYTLSRHTLAGAVVRRDLARGREAHVFDDPGDLARLEQMVWAHGAYLGRVGTGQRALFERYCWRSRVPVGRRTQTGRADLLLHWVEIKGRAVGSDWVYHLVPRARPPS